MDRIGRRIIFTSVMLGTMVLSYVLATATNYVTMSKRLDYWDKVFGVDATTTWAKRTLKRDESLFDRLRSYGDRLAAWDYLEDGR